jgi:NADH:ubiquinone oxidoreductase subunit E
MDNIQQIIATHAGREGPLLPILHDVQAEFGHISEEAIRTIAAALNLSRADVHGVVSFYHDFHEAVEPRAVLKLCRATRWRWLAARMMWLLSLRRRAARLSGCHLGHALA